MIYIFYLVNFVHISSLLILTISQESLLTLRAVHTAPARIFKEKYLTKKGKKLMALATTDKERKIIRSKYEKNRYMNNPDCDAFRNPNGKIRRIKHT